MIRLQCIVIYSLLALFQVTSSNRLRGSLSQEEAFTRTIMFTRNKNIFVSTMFGGNFTVDRRLEDKDSGTEKSSAESNSQTASVRTATGGLINNILIFFSILAFVGNALFMINVFWMSR